MERNRALSTIEKCKISLGGIEDHFLRMVALTIFAPKGTEVPSPYDHSEALANLDSYNTRKNVNIKDLFVQNKSAFKLLWSAVNTIHKVYKAKQLSRAEFIEALEIIDEEAKPNSAPHLLK